MQNTLILLAVTLSPTFGNPKVCNDGVILVGGATPSGPALKVKLLKENGLCDQSGFPDLPEPLTSPGVFFSFSFLFVCGFSGTYPCKATQRGWEEWQDVVAITGDSHFQMAVSSKVGGVMMTSKQINSTLSNHIQHIHPTSSPVGRTSWMEMVGSPFNLSTTYQSFFTYHRDISNSCLTSFQGDLILTGGSESEYCSRCSSSGSQPYVAKWSIEGRADGMGPPEFEDGIVQNMNEAREAHACLEFEDGIVVSGGFRYRRAQGPNGGPPSETVELKNSAEFYNGVEWIQMQNMLMPRSSFQLQPMCGAVLAIGGESLLNAETGGTFLETVEQIWSAQGSWSPAPWLDLPEPLAYAGSSSVSDMDCWTG